MPYGIPLPAYGIQLDDPDVGEDYPDIIPILELLGINVDTNTFIDIPNNAHTIANILANDLAQRPEKEYQQVAWLFSFLFSMTGNSVCDWHHEIMCEVEALSWDEIDFARVMISEAEEIMSDVWTGLSWLNNQDNVLQSLEKNIQKITKILKRRKGKDNDALPAVRLQWTNIEYSSQRAA